MIQGLILVFSLLWTSLAWTNWHNANTNQLIEKMSLEKKVGQLFILGFVGTEYDKSLKKQIQELSPGAIIVFGRNIKTLHQIKELNSQAQRETLQRVGVPLLIAVDQEGGDVIRIKTSPSLPSARTLALTDNQPLVQETGYVTGRLLNILGFNMNLAPVVDISQNGVSDFLGNRSFGFQKEVVSTMSAAFARGLVDAGVLPTAKHFPGHGGIQTDSHLRTPTKEITLTELLFNDLSPYKELQRKRIPFAIMASHVSYPLIDPSKKPASYSETLLQNVLRSGVGFDGIVLTDDIQMEGASDGGISIEKRAVQAVAAGNDLVMVGWNHQNQKRAIRAVIAAVRSGKLSETRIDQSLKRLIQFKKDFYNSDKPSIELKTALNQIPLKKTYDRIFHEVFKKQALPKDLGATSNWTIFSYSWSFLEAFKSKSRGRLYHLQSFKGWDKIKKQHGPILFHVSGQQTEQILNSAPHSLRSRLIVVNSSKKLKLDHQEEYLHTIHVHSNHPQLGQFASRYLSEPIRKAASSDPKAEETY